MTGIRPELLLAVVAAERVYEEAGHDFTITSCVDGKHMAGSLHYAGAAIDIRTRDVGGRRRSRNSALASRRAWQTTTTWSSKATTSTSSFNRSGP